MQRVTMLATPDGEWVFEGTPEFLAALGDPDPDYDAGLFAVKNLGFVRLQILSGAVIEVELHPRNVEIPALLAAQQQLLNAKVQLFRIKYLDATWISEILASPEAAVARLSELCSRQSPPPDNARFVVEPQDCSVLFENNGTPLRLLAQKWRVSFGNFDPGVISFAIKHDLLSRLMIASVRPSNPEPVFRFIGDGHANWLRQEFRFQAIGEKFENLPDKDYGQWVSEFYKNVARTGEPRYDYVTAAIAQKNGVHRTRYERLVLPWKTSSKEVLVTLLSRGLSAEEISGSSAPPSKSRVVRNSKRSS